MVVDSVIDNLFLSFFEKDDWKVGDAAMIDGGSEDESSFFDVHENRVMDFNLKCEKLEKILSIMLRIMGERNKGSRMEIRSRLILCYISQSQTANSFQYNNRILEHTKKRVSQTSGHKFSLFRPLTRKR